MDKELQIFLDTFKREANSIVDSYLEAVKTASSSGGMDAFEWYYRATTHTESDAIKATNDYRKVYKAFRILSSIKIVPRHREKEADGTLSSKITYDEVSELNRLKIKMSFSSDDIKAMANSVIKDDKQSFYELVLQASGNKTHSQRYTKEVFGQGVRK